MTIEGTVEATNDHGVRIRGEWFNVSKFVPISVPPVGTYVRLEVDGKSFIRDLSTVADETLDDAAPDGRGVRLAVLQSAAFFGASRPDLKSADVLRIADSWLEWVEQE